MELYADIKTQTIRDTEHQHYSFAEASELIESGKVKDFNLILKRLISYDGDWQALQAYYDSLAD